MMRDRLHPPKLWAAGCRPQGAGATLGTGSRPAEGNDIAVQPDVPALGDVNAPAELRAGVTPQWLRFDRPQTFWGLLLPPSLWLALFLLVPLLLIGAFSFRADLRGDLLAPFSPTLTHYQKLLDKPSYLRLLGISVGMALVVAASAVTLAYPVAYFLAFRAGPRLGLFLILLLVPFWTSFLLRIMAWKVLLGSGGVVNSFLQYVGLIEEPLGFLLYNRGTVVVTLIYVWIPFVALPIYAVLQRIDTSLFEAAADLGATRAQTFRRVVLPLSLPGVVAAFITCFIPTIGEYVTPLLVGGSRGSMYGNLIQDFFTKAANWPLGAALSLVMLLVTMVLTGIAVRFVDLRRVAP
jgi:spermidine/putrescine transport system permease protein